MNSGGTSDRLRRILTLVGAAGSFTAAAALVNQLANGRSWLVQAALFAASVFAFTAGLAIEDYRRSAVTEPGKGAGAMSQRVLVTPMPDGAKELAAPARYDFRFKRGGMLASLAIFQILAGAVWWYAAANDAWGDGSLWLRFVGQLAACTPPVTLAYTIAAGFGYPRLRIDQLGVQYIPGIGRRTTVPWAELTDVSIYGGKLVCFLRPNSPLVNHQQVKKMWRDKLGGHMIANLRDLIATPDDLLLALEAMRPASN